MSVQKLDVFHLRNIQQASIEPAEKLNLITGNNASGKSALLEAVFVLGRGRSFRTAKIQQAINFNHHEFVISAVVQDGALSTRVGIQVSKDKTQCRINQEDCSKADLAYRLPIQIIHPKSYQLLDGGPQYRREFIDWGVFNDDPHYLDCWRKFKKVLKQRNSLLKAKQLQQLDVWDRELVHYGELLTQYRRQYMQRLQPVFQQVSEFFIPEQTFTLSFTPGWLESTELVAALQHDREKDIRYGFTHSGPHRSDFSLKFNRYNVRDFVSRGQLKLLVLSLLLAQVQLLDLNNHQACILIDDLTAELDTENRSKLLKYLFKLNNQAFISANDFLDLSDLPLPDETKMFHVEHGQVGEKCFT
jgi:DNA replication and repair protein RecF